MRRAGSSPCSAQRLLAAARRADAVEQRVADELDARQPAARRAPGSNGNTTASRSTQPRDLAAPGRAATPTPGARCSRGPARPRASRDPREAQVELREVDQDAEVGPSPRAGGAPARGRRARACAGAPRPRRRPTVATSPRVGDGVHARGAQPLAARARTPRRRAAARAARAAGRRRAGRRTPRRRPAGRGAAAETRSACDASPESLIRRRAACAARTSVSTLSRITCATSSARSPSQPVTGGVSPRAHGLDERVDLLLERVALARPRAPRR